MFSLSTVKYAPEETLYLGTIHAVVTILWRSMCFHKLIEIFLLWGLTQHPL